MQYVDDVIETPWGLMFVVTAIALLERFPLCTRVDVGEMFPDPEPEPPKLPTVAWINQPHLVPQRTTCAIEHGTPPLAVSRTCGNGVSAVSRSTRCR